jgi:ABC-type nitrate/sulfonate/bicarbonate transport system substrate-binding protein
MKVLQRWQARQTRQRFAAKLGAAVAAALACGVLASSASGAVASRHGMATVRFAVSTNVLAQAVVAEHLGYFKKYGINAKLQNYATGVDGLTAVLTGQADISAAFGFPVLGHLSSNGLGVIGTDMRPTPGFYQLAIKAPLTAASQLAGKRVGIITGTDEVYSTYQLLKSDGVNPSSVTFVGFPDLFGAVAALQAGQIDATLVYPPGSTQAAAIPGVKLVSATETGIEPCYIVASRRILTNSRKVVAEAMEALIQANTWMVKHLQAASNLVADFVQAPKDSLYKSMTVENYTVGWKGQDATSFTTIANFLAGQHYVQSAPILVNYLDLVPLRLATRALKTHHK